jgi:hypothetical protein
MGVLGEFARGRLAENLLVPKELPASGVEAKEMARGAVGGR